MHFFPARSYDYYFENHFIFQELQPNNGTINTKQENFDSSNVPKVVCGTVRLHLLWDVKKFAELKVHFLNPGLLEEEKWMCGRAQLTINNVLDWAGVWNSHAVHYPKISDDFATKEEAQIRVLFTSNST